MAKSLSDLTGKSGNKPTKPQRVADHNRILAGRPFMTKGCEDRHMVEIPGPVGELECPERPAPGWEKRGVPVGDGNYKFFWFHPQYAERARMWQFQTSPGGNDDRDMREAFGDPNLGRRDLQ